MKRRFGTNTLFLFSFVLLSSSFCDSCMAQVLKQGEPIEIQGPKQNILMQNGAVLDSDDLKYIMGNNAQSMEYMRKASVNSGWGTAFSVVGGLAVGAAVGSWLRTGDLPTATLITGLAFAALTIPFVIGEVSNTELAVGVYNDSLQKPPSGANSKAFNLHLGLCSSGVGVGISF